MYLWVWRLQQFRSVNGREAISDWRKNLSPARRAAFDTFIDRVAKMKTWPTGICDPIHGNGKDARNYWELRWSAEKVQHRIFGYYDGASVFVMLVGCTHKGKIYDPRDAFQTMRDREKKIREGEGMLVAYVSGSVIGNQEQGLSSRPSGRPN